MGIRKQEYGEKESGYRGVDLDNYQTAASYTLSLYVSETWKLFKPIYINKYYNLTC